MSSDDQSDKECPLCMEAFDIDDTNFFPCSCQYQICRFCWHRIRTNENGLCPACRQTYPEDPVNFQPLSNAELQKIKIEKKQKIQQQKNKLIEGRKHLAEFRVLQKNLVYAVGISQRMADPELLKKPEFFGKFGKIIKVAVGTAQALNNSQPPTHTSYITYTRCEDALRAIQAVNNLVVDGRLLKASLGTTKYCSNFLKGQSCHKPECMYLHDEADQEISFTKEDMHQGKHTEYERRLYEQMTFVLSQQQPISTSFYPTHNGKETNKAKTNKFTEQGEKKRQSGGSIENLVKITHRRTHQKKAGNGIGHNTEGAKTSTSGWDEVKIGRGGSETRELNSKEIDSTIYGRRNTKSMVKSMSPTTIPDCLEIKSTESMPAPPSFSTVKEKEKLIALEESDSSPIPPSASPTPPLLLKELNGLITTGINSLLVDQQPLAPPSQLTNSNSSTNYLMDHDDDFGFDPFAESAKALGEIIEEEKLSLPLNNQNGLDCTIATSFAPSFYRNNLFNQTQPPPPGLHSGFSNNFGQAGTPSLTFNTLNRMHGSTNSLSDLRESFKAMLPNVNVHFVSEQNNENRQQSQMQQQNFGGLFGTIGNNNSTSSLPSFPSNRSSNVAAIGVSNPSHFRPSPFGMDQQRAPLPLPSQHQMQQRQQQPQRSYQSFGPPFHNNFTNTNGPFPSNAHLLPSSTFSQTSNLFGNSGVGSFPPLQPNHFGMTSHPQRHHHLSQSQQQQLIPTSGGSTTSGTYTNQFGEHMQQQHQSASNSSSWLPVPPGFSPRASH